MEQIARIFLGILGCLGVLGTLVSHLAWNRWWIHSISNAWLQLTLVSAVVLVLCLWLLDLNQLWAKGVVAALALALVYQISILLPYTTLWAMPVAIAEAIPEPAGESDASPRAFKFMVANVEIENEDYAQFLKLVEVVDPDVLQVIEIDESWQAALAPLRERYAHHTELPQDNAYGMGIYSRVPLENVEIMYLEDPGTPAIRGELVFGAGTRVQIYGLHPRPPLPPGADTDVNEDATEDAKRELRIIAEMISEASLPVVVGGDLNDVPWSHSLRQFREISGLAEVRMGRGLLTTFQATSHWMRMPLDHIYLSSELGLIDYQILDPFGSDHHAIVATLRVEAPTPE